MKISEKIWIERLTQTILSRPCQEINNQYILQQHVNLFLEELCYLCVEYINYFNSIVSNSDCNSGSSTPLAWSLFALTQPRIGLIVARGKDKLVISAEGQSVHIKMLQSELHKERLHESLYFTPKTSSLGTVNWHCANDGQYVIPELVVKNYLSSFMAYGCKGISPAYPRLVAVGGS